MVTGRGRAFCTGADLSDPEIALDGALEERPAKLAVLMRETINPLMEELRSFPKPTIAAVNGPAVGGGIGIALSTDITIAASSAYFMQVFTPKLGLVPDMGVTWYLERLVGRARARGLAMLGDRLPAQEAADWGMIWKAVPDDMFSAEVTALANRIAGGPDARHASSVQPPRRSSLERSRDAARSRTGDAMRAGADAGRAGGGARVPRKAAASVCRPMRMTPAQRGRAAGEGT